MYFNNFLGKFCKVEYILEKLFYDYVLIVLNFKEVFNAFHKEFDKVNRYSKLYHIGRIDPNDVNEYEPKNEQQNNRQAEIRKDFENVRKLAREMDLFKPSTAFYVLNGIHIILAHIAGYYILLKYGCSFVPLMFALILHLIAQVTINSSKLSLSFEYESIKR